MKLISFAKKISGQDFRLLMAVFLIAFLPLIYQMGNTHIQPTADLWVQRSVSFMTEFRRFNFAGTFQQYHPGVMVMWPVAVGSWFFYHIVHASSPVVPDIFSPQYFSEYVVYAKIPLMLLQAIFMVLIFLILRKISGVKIALLSTLLLALEPFYLANARTIHLDTMLTLTMFAAILSMYRSLGTKLSAIKAWDVLTGALFGFSWLSKIVTAYLIPFSALALLITPGSIRDKFKKFALYLLIGLGIFVIFYPAMWVAPYETLVGKIIHGGVLEVGLEDVSRGLLIGSNSGLFYHLFGYPLTIIYRLSPLISLGLAAFMAQLLFFRKSDPVNKRFTLYLFLFAFFYLAMMSFSTKKIYRYMLPVFPVLAVYSAYGWFFISTVLKENLAFNKERVFTYVVAFIMFAYAACFLRIAPNFFAYFNPLLGGITGAKEIVDLNQDATGYYLVADYLNQLAPGKVVACYDWKILGLLYQGETLSIRREEKPITADFILLPLQRGYEWLTNEYNLIKTFKVAGVDYWYLYQRAN